MEITTLNIIIGAVIALSGVFLNNIYNRANLKKQMEYQKQVEFEKMMRVNLEETYQLLLQLQNRLYVYHRQTTQIHVLGSEMETRNKAIDDLMSPFNRLGTMLTFYAPSLLNDFEPVMASLLNYQQYALMFQEIQVRDGEQLDKHFEVAQDKINFVMTGIEKLARQYTTLNSNLNNK